MPIAWACLTACSLNSAVYSCFGIFFTSLTSGLNANHRPLEDEKRLAPQGLIFMGDGGAYFIGYLMAVLSLLLVARNRGVESPWYPFLLFIYPVFETLFSIWRKWMVRGGSPGVPDGLHLHMLVFRRLVRWAVGQRDAASLTLRNSMTAPYLWMLSSVAAVPATLFWRYPHVLQALVAVFCLLYVWLYLRLVRFRAPRWLVVHSRGLPSGADSKSRR